MRAEDDRYSEIIEDQHLLYLLRQFRFLWPNPLTPRSDKHETSPCNIHTLISKQVMRIFKLIR